MPLNYQLLEDLRQRNPAWKLLRSDHTALIVSFLDRVFIAPNRRLISQTELAELLEDDLYALRDQFGFEDFPKSALDYLNDWANPEKPGCENYTGRARMNPT